MAQGRSGAAAQKVLWWGTFLLAALPAARLVFRAFWGDLGPDPLVTLEHGTGYWAFVLLVVTLCITPIRRLSGWNPVIKLRKMLGNWSAAYAVGHVTVYAWLDQGLDWPSIWSDALDHKRIFLGLAAFLILLVLAATSPVFMVRRLGRRWGTIHKLVYGAIILAVVHFALTQKLDWREPVLWGTGVAVLLGVRLWWGIESRAKGRA
ncbi:MAG TPA: protein-methionine-sulfoxide reductase heme-binding subunit MsrQ [Gemmatimonadales bacterium]|nr:protein-methionine-sulfoxide reductase heme-binding subunit MsrQ [Gemmatimonadales bacterium]